MTVVNATMVPSLLYDCEVWSLTKQQLGRVHADYPNECAEKKSGSERLDRMRSEEIRQRLGQKDILDVWRRQEKWKCKLDDMNSDRTTKKMYVGVMEGRRLSGRIRVEMDWQF